MEWPTVTPSGPTAEPDALSAWIAGLKFSDVAPPPPAEVMETEEFQRIRDAAWHDWERAEDLPEGVAKLTAWLRTPNGEQVFYPRQAAALRMLHDFGCAFVPIRTAGGKTLPGFAAGEVVRALRPLLIVPAKMIKSGKTQREHAAYSRHWRIRPLMSPAASKARGAISLTSPLPLRVISYEALGRDNYRTALEAWLPDLIICDEAHKLRRTSSAVTKTIGAYLRKHRARVLLMTGSAINRQIAELAHLLRWCLGDHTPLPRDFYELRSWGWALNEKVPQGVRVAPGALLKIAPPIPEDEEFSDIDKARRRFGRRLMSTIGVVGSTDALPPVPLTCEVVKRKPTPEVLSASEHMRVHEETPCGIPMEQPALEIWRHERELSCDFYYRWDVQPPFKWVLARKAWSAFVRDQLKRSRTLFSPMDVANAVDRGQIADGGMLKDWRSVAHLFDPEKHKEPVWIGDSMLRDCAAWLEKEKGICWVIHTVFGARLSQVTGIPYFAAGGKSQGVAIDQHEGPAIASVKAVGEGFNLQHLHHKCLFPVAPSTGTENEQAISRVHRDGNLKDVEITYFVTLEGDMQALQQARADAMATQNMMTQPQRLCAATWLNE